MVEGPKVKIKCARLQCLVGQTIQRIESTTKLKAAVELSQIQRIVFVGKELFFLLCNDSALRLHFGMSGYERVLPIDRHVKSTLPNHYTHAPSFTIYLDNSTAYFFGTTISVRYTMDVDISLSRMHRDIMAESLDVEEVLSYLKNDDRPIYESIMDQAIMPGVGNVIKCEGLYSTKIHPEAISQQIEPQRLIKLVKNLQAFSWDWYRCTLRGKDVKKRVYGRPHCEICRGQVTLMRSGDSDRITYFCETCQALDQSYSSALTASYKKGTVGAWLKGSVGGPESWHCASCTYHNLPGCSACSMCGNKAVATAALRPPLNSTSNSSSGLPTPATKDEESIALFVDVKCKCGGRASVARVRNDGANKNRLYHACAGGVYECGSMSRKRCDYFSWADASFPVCRHGKLSTLRRVLKPGTNNGRYFFCCNMDKPKTCDFFVFLEDARLTTPASTSRSESKENEPPSKRPRIHLEMDSTVKLPL